MLFLVFCPSLDSPSNGMINCSLGDDEVPSYDDIMIIFVYDNQYYLHKVDDYNYNKNI